MKKYELTDETINAFGKTLYRIKALKSFADVEAGEKGGYVEKTANLSQEGNSWVSGNARVYGNSKVYDNAKVYENAWVYDNAMISGNARVHGHVTISGNARVYGDAQVYDNVTISDNARVYGETWVNGNSRVSNNARVSGNAQVSGNAWISGDAMISGDAQIRNRMDVLWMTPVGSEKGTLTVSRSKSGGLIVNRGCFIGTLGDFEKAVEITHGDNRYGKEYKAAIEFIKLRFDMKEINKLKELKKHLEDLKRQIKDREKLIKISEAINLDALVVTLYHELDLIVSQAFIIETEILRMEAME